MPSAFIKPNEKYKGRNIGSAIFLAKKDAPDADLKRPLHYRKRWTESATKTLVNAS